MVKEGHAKEIAKKLIIKMLPMMKGSWSMVQEELDNAKKCAIIACDLKIEGQYPWQYNYILYHFVKEEIVKIDKMEQLNEN